MNRDRLWPIDNRPGRLHRAHPMEIDFDPAARGRFMELGGRRLEPLTLLRAVGDIDLDGLEIGFGSERRSRFAARRRTGRGLIFGAGSGIRRRRCRRPVPAGEQAQSHEPERCRAARADQNRPAVRRASSACQAGPEPTRTRDDRSGRRRVKRRLVVWSLQNHRGRGAGWRWRRRPVGAAASAKRRG